MPFPCPHCATPQEDDNTSCNHCGLAFGPGTDRPGAATPEVNETNPGQVTNFQELLAAVAARGSEVDPRAIPPPAPVLDLSKPDPNEYPQQGQPYPQPGQQYPGQGYGQQLPQQGQYFPPGQQYGNQPGFNPGQQPFGQQAPYNITLYPNGGQQGMNITQYPQFSGMNATIMPVAVPVRQGLSVWATLLIAALFGTLIAMVVFLLLHSGLSSGPSVRISEPTAGTIIATGQPVDFSVEAKENMGHLTNVDFYYQPTNHERTFIKTVLSPPYSAQWTPGTSGDYVLQAIATDDHGVTATAQTSVRVNGDATAEAPPPAAAPLKTLTPISPVKPLPTVHAPASIKPAVAVAPIVVKSASTSPNVVTRPVNVEALQRARANRAERIAAYRREHAAPHPAPAPVVAAKPAPVNQSGNKQFHITTLVSPRRQNADILAAALRKRGINVHTQRVGGGWAVETPGYHNKAEADSAAKQLQKSGYNAGVSTQ